METITNEIKEVQTIAKKDFIAIWKKISNDKKRLPTFVQQRAYGQTIKVKQKGFIYPEHHVLYNMVRGLPLSRGFMDGTEGYKNALSEFAGIPYPSYLAPHMYEPFKDYMTREQFIALMTEARDIYKYQK